MVWAVIISAAEAMTPGPQDDIDGHLVWDELVVQPAGEPSQGWHGFFCALMGRSGMTVTSLSDRSPPVDWGSGGKLAPTKPELVDT